MSPDQGEGMERPTEQETDEAIALLEFFVKHSLDMSAQNAPGIDDVKLAVATVILWNNFDEGEYEIRELIRQLEPKKAVSFRALNAHLINFVAHASNLRFVEKARKSNPGPFSDDPF
jgi:hypothetical protein